MKFGINTFLWTVDFAEKHLELLPAIREHGFEGIEMFVHTPSLIPAAAIRRGLEAAEMGCTFCTAFAPDQNFADPDPAVRAHTVQHVTDCVKAVAEAGGTALAGPTYTPLGVKPGRRTDDEWKRVVESLQKLGDVLEANKVTLCVEPLNRFETHFLNTSADALKLVDAVNHPRIGILWDTFHSNIEEKDSAAALKHVLPRLRHFHASENDRGTPGSGQVDWDRILPVLKESGYNGWVTIESFGSTIKEIAAAACIWRDIEPTPESIAWDGIKFLRSRLG